MAGKGWTSKEIKLCSAAYSEGGLEQAKLVVDRSMSSIITMMSYAGTKAPTNTGKKIQKYYAEDIILMFEMANCGLKHSIIGEYFNTTRAAIKFTIHNARKNGFDAYPMREK